MLVDLTQNNDVDQPTVLAFLKS